LIKMTQAANLWLEELSKDSINDPLDSLRMVWQQVRSQGARYAEAITYMQVGEWQAARTVVENIPQEHVLKGDEMGERGRMLALIDLMETVAMDNRAEDELTVAEQDALEAQMSPYADRPAVWAQNLLCFHYGRCMAPVTGGENEPKSSYRRDAPKGDGISDLIQVAPNPANTWTEIQLMVVRDEVTTIRVLDLAGKLLVTQVIQPNQERVVLDTRALAPGAYQLELVLAGTSLASTRLIVQP
jgi:hypothetical protein